MAVKLVRRNNASVGQAAKATHPKPVARGDDQFGLQTLQPVPWLPKGYLSLSAARMYLRCPKQFEFRYVDGVKSPPAVALSEGKAHHSALQLDNEHRIKKSKPVSLSVMLENFEASFEDEAKGIEDWEGESKKSVILRGRDLLTTYAARSSWLQPIAAEKRFEVEIGPDKVPMLGFMDVVDATSVMDYKVVGRAKSESDAKQDLQLALYAQVAERKNVAFVSLVKTATDPAKQVQVAKAKLTKSDVEWSTQVISSVARAIKAGAFPLTEPGNWGCSERFCGFWHLCRGKKR
jgi:CRISPR/Cas system-associated exonuclease Cas4 (RecB family)